MIEFTTGSESMGHMTRKLLKNIPVKWINYTCVIRVSQWTDGPAHGGIIHVSFMSNHHVEEGQHEGAQTVSVQQ